jgi:hypothetical protein
MKYNLPQSFSTAISFKLLPYLRLALILVLGFALTNIGLRAFTQSTLPLQVASNPFLEYQDIFPGLSLDGLKSRAFSCRSIYPPHAPSDVSCALDLSSGDFSRIETVVLSGFIRQTIFTLRDDSLKVGNLILLFDSPNFRVYPRKVFFFWNKLFAIVSTSAKSNPTAMRPVWNVTFTDTY